MRVVVALEGWFYGGDVPGSHGRGCFLKGGGSLGSLEGDGFPLGVLSEEGRFRVLHLRGCSLGSLKGISQGGVVRWYSLKGMFYR